MSIETLESTEKKKTPWKPQVRRISKARLDLADDHPESSASVGMRVAQLRVSLNSREIKKQAEWARDLGIKPNAISQYESGDVRPGLDLAISWCRKYRITLDWLYYGDKKGLAPDLLQAISVAHHRLSLRSE